jgi:hypothetical protein
MGWEQGRRSVEATDISHSGQRAEEQRRDYSGPGRGRRCLCPGRIPVPGEGGRVT